MALLTNMKKLLIGLFASVSVAAPVAYIAHDYFVSAPATAFSISATSVQAGGSVVFTITRTSGNGIASMVFTTHNGTAVGGIDYNTTVKLVSFSRLQRTVSLIVPTHVNTHSTGNLTFSGNVSYNGKISTTNATILKGAVVVTPPATQTCYDGSVIPLTSTCPSPPPSSLPGRVVAEGDSITVGGYVSQYATSHPTVNVYNIAVGGSTLNDMRNRYSTAIGYNPSIYTILAGTNGFPVTYQNGVYTLDGALWHEEYMTYLATVRAAGIKVLVGTLLPQCNPTNDGGLAAFNSGLAAENARIKAEAGVRIDGYFDFASLVTGTQSSWACNTANLSDGTHPTQAVQTQMSAIYGTAVDAALAGASYVISPTTAGLSSVADNFDVNQALELTGGTGTIPPSGSPDVVGAFRFICTFDKLLADDPIVYPGQAGRSHMHNFYGNDLVNANSTFNLFRTTGGSSCNHYGNGTTAANRSAYWIPGMDDGKGHWVQPDYAALYYKRRPASDPVVSNPANSQYMGQAVPLPNGIRFIFGYNMGNPSAGTTGGPFFNCSGPTATEGHYADIPTAMANCPAGNRLGYIIEGPNCWDGLYLDTPDHRSHTSYAAYGDGGYLKCDSAHPYVMPQLTLGTWWSVQAGDDLSLWHFASDEMHPELAHGKTGHADYFEAWSNPVKTMWENNCINLLLNCNSGDLGNGKQLRGAGIPTYIIGGVPVQSWTNPNRLVNK